MTIWTWLLPKMTWLSIQYDYYNIDIEQHCTKNFIQIYTSTLSLHEFSVIIEYHRLWFCISLKRPPYQSNYLITILQRENYENCTFNILDKHIPQFKQLYFPTIKYIRLTAFENWNIAQHYQVQNWWHNSMSNQVLNLGVEVSSLQFTLCNLFIGRH